MKDTIKANECYWIGKAINTRSGEYHQIPYEKDFSGDFIHKCEFFIAQHFGEHLSYYLRKSYQEGDE